MNFRPTLYLFVGLIAGVGCDKSGGGSYVPKPTPMMESAAGTEGIEQNYIPVGVGKQWTYEVEAKVLRNGQVRTVPAADLNYKITKVENVDGGEQVSWEITLGTKVTDRQIWLINKNGIYQVAIGLSLNKYTTPQPILEFPAKEGGGFQWKGSGTLANGMLGSNSVNAKYLGMQEVDLENGRTKAFAIESTMDFSTTTGRGGGKSTIWLTPGVGIVRYTQTIFDGKSNSQQTLRLKSHS